MTDQLDLFQEAPDKLAPRTIYLVGIDTDSADINVIPFYEKYEALAYARQQFTELIDGYENYSEVREEKDMSAYDLRDGWFYSATDWDGIQVWCREAKIR